MINVILVDSHKLFRESLTCLLEKDNLIKVVSEADNFLDIKLSIDSMDADIIIFDIDKSCNGIELIEYVKRKNISAKLLVLSSIDDNEIIVKINNYETDGFLLKSTDSVELIGAINSIMSGRRYVQSTLIPVINNYLIKRDMDSDKINSLTSRELQILKMIASGKKNIEIANNMTITERTVKNHISHIFDKIEVKDRTQAAVFAIRNSIVELYDKKI